MKNKCEITKNQFDILEQSKVSCEFLSNSIKEIEEQVDILGFQLMESQKKLTNLRSLLSELNKGDENNLKLFSPNYDKIYNDTETKTEIEELSCRSIKIIKEIDILDEKKKSLIETKECMEFFMTKALEKPKDDETEFRKRYSEDIGLNILKIQETERQRIARDLHDTTVQNLANLVHRTELCSKLLDVDSIRAKLELITMSKTIKSDIDDMRFIIYNLRPMSIDDLGLINTVERYVKQLIDSYEVNVTLSANDENIYVLPVISLTLFRIIQEACNNILKHAHATQVNIDIYYQDESITVTVRDNGVGFDQQTINSKHSVDALSGLGLSIMKERICLMSGKIEINSEINNGTTIIVSVPFSISKEGKNESD